MVLHESPQDRHTQNGVSLSIISPTPRASPSPLQWTEKVSPPILLRLPVPVRLSAAKGIFLDANMVWSRHSSEPSRDPPHPHPLATNCSQDSICSAVWFPKPYPVWSLHPVLTLSSYPTHTRAHTRAHMCTHMHVHTLQLCSAPSLPLLALPCLASFYSWDSAQGAGSQTSTLSLGSLSFWI